MFCQLHHNFMENSKFMNYGSDGFNRVDFDTLTKEGQDYINDQIGQWQSNDFYIYGQMKVQNLSNQVSLAENLNLEVHDCECWIVKSQPTGNSNFSILPENGDNNFQYKSRFIQNSYISLCKVSVKDCSDDSNDEKTEDEENFQQVSCKISNCLKQFFIENNTQNSQLVNLQIQATNARVPLSLQICVAAGNRDCILVIQKINQNEDWG